MRLARRGAGRLASVSAANGGVARIEARRAAAWSHLWKGGLRQA